MKAVEAAARDALHALVAVCTDGQRDLFRRMYDHQGKHERPVDGIPFERLDNAFCQVELTLAKNADRSGPDTASGKEPQR